jgi:hypothetical protein
MSPDATHGARSARPTRRRLLGAARAASAAALVAVAPGRVAAQDARLERRLDAPTRDVVARLVDSARSAGLPTEPLVDKALEGASKRASGDRIAQAVRTLTDELAQARALLGADASVSEVVAGARALRAGVSPATLQRFQRERARRPITVALVVLGELVAQGVAPDTAARTVLALTAEGARDDELVAYQRGFTRGLQAGAPPVPRVGGDALAAEIQDRSTPTNLQGTGAGRASTTPPPRRKAPRP